MSKEFNHEDEGQAEIYKRKTKKNPDNQVLCPLCFEEVRHFARHLERKHSEDESVKKISKMPLGSNERRCAIMALRKKGYFLLKNEKEKFKPLRENAVNTNDGEYLPCVNCIGFYKKTYFGGIRKVARQNQIKISGNLISTCQMRKLFW